MMEWSELSREAKNILEMTVGPDSGIRYSISIRVGERPLFDGRPFSTHSASVDRFVFEEIMSFLGERIGDFETLEIGENHLRIRLGTPRIDLPTAP